MNVLWIAAIAAFVLIEKAAPFGLWARRGAGALFVAWGIVTLAGFATS
jgi:predicted metal-binding membrane protein